MTLSGLFAAVILATICNKKWPKLPEAFWQIGMGLVLSFLPLPFSFHFEPEMFLICIIAPLLFSEGQHISRRELWDLRKPVFLLAFGLVLMTVLAGGYFINWLIAGMPMAVAFALAAILSPTDTVAVESITRGMKFPGDLKSILEGESLLNDAAGVVAFNVALAAAITGVFEIGDASVQLLQTAVGGVLVGFLVGFGFVKFRLEIRKRNLDEIPMMVVIQLMTPLVVYFLAEELGFSGILAVVTAGIIHGVERDRLRKTTTKQQLILDNTWSVLSYLLNGLVFVLLGFLLQSIYAGVADLGSAEILKLSGASLIIALVLFLVRFLWVFIWYRCFKGNRKNLRSLIAQHREGLNSEEEKEGAEGDAVRPDSERSEADGRGSRKGSDRGDSRIDRKAVGKSRLRYAVLTAFCGVHGTFTLATALSIPFMISEGVAFPMRSSVLFIASGVILISLLAAAIALPRLAERPEEVDGTWLTVEQAQGKILSYAISKLRQEPHQAVLPVIEGLVRQLAALENEALSRPDRKVIETLMSDAEQAAVDAVEELCENGEISDQVLKVYQHFSKKMGGRHKKLLGKKLLLPFRGGRVKGKQRKLWDSGFREQESGSASERRDLLREFHLAQKVGMKAAVAFLEGESKRENRSEILWVTQIYNRYFYMLSVLTEKDGEYERMLSEYNAMALTLERDGIHQLLETGCITSETAKELQSNILYDEMLALGE